MDSKKISINVNELKRKVSSIYSIHEKLDNLKIRSLSLDKIIKNIKSEYYKLHFANDAAHVIYDLIDLINSYYKKVKKILDEKPLLKTNGDVKLILQQIKEYKNNVINYNSHSRKVCKDCGVIFVYNGVQYVCEHCGNIQKVLYKFKSNIDNMEEIKSNKKNISKHYDDKWKQILGEVSVEKALPDQVIVLFKEYLDKNGIYIPNCIHYTHSLQDCMKKVGKIAWNDKLYNIKNYKTQTNYILLKMYPELKMPKLTNDEMNMIYDIFIEITAEFQHQNPSKYCNNYNYTIFKIIYIMMPYNPRARELLRYITIQNPTSFATKDKKLERVNKVLGIFEHFVFTSKKIYDEKKFYQVEQFINRRKSSIYQK